MRTRLLFIMMLVAATATINAQEQAQTAPPVITSDYFYLTFDSSPFGIDYNEVYAHFGYQISIYNADEDQAIVYYTQNGSDWYELDYNPAVVADRPGYYEIQAYAQAPGKLPSEITTYGIYAESAGTEILYRVCLVDGIHYLFNDGNPYWEDNLNGVSVSSTEYSHLYSPRYSGEIVIPSEIEFNDETFAVTGIYTHAFASTDYDPSEITSIELPYTISYILHAPFFGCLQLKRITVHAINPPVVYDTMFASDYYEDMQYYYAMGFDVNELYRQVTLYVPNESLEAYRAHEEWGRFSRIVPFVGAGPGDVNGDGSIAISDVTNLIDQLLSGEEMPAYIDVNGDGAVTITDVTALIDMLLSGK